MTYNYCTLDWNANNCISRCCSYVGSFCQPTNTLCNTNINGLVNSAANLGIGLIVGVSVAAVAFVVILAVSIYCCVKRCRARNIVVGNAATVTFVPGSVPMHNMNMGNGGYMGQNFANQPLMGAQGAPYQPNVTNF